MKTATRLALALLLIQPGVSASSPAETPGRLMALTFDDLPAQRAQAQPHDLLIEITEGMLGALGETPAIGFVNEVKLYSGGALLPERVKLLERWLEAGAELGNHSYSHPDLHRTALADFQLDVERGETVTRPLVEVRGGKLRYFRHPFLHSGLDLETKRGLHRFLTRRGYAVAPVTIDNSEWIFGQAYLSALERGDGELRERVASAYVDYMERMVEYYEGQSRALFGREIPQVLLLHANALNGHHLGRLLAKIRQRGYRFVDLETALRDPAYDSPNTYVGRGGITWLHRWAITRGVDRSMFRGEPSTPEWVQKLAGIEE